MNEDNSINVSILTSVKDAIGITEEFTKFNGTIVMHINTALATLTQMGVGPEKGLRVIDETTTWDKFIPTESNEFNSVMTYVTLKVRQIFDPPTSSALMEANERTIKELEWRLNVAAENNTI